MAFFNTQQELNNSIEKIKFIRENIDSIVLKNFKWHRSRVKFIKELSKIHVSNLEKLIDYVNHNKIVSKDVKKAIRKINRILSQIEELPLVKKMFIQWHIQFQFCIEAIENIAHRIIKGVYTPVFSIHKLKQVWLN